MGRADQAGQRSQHATHRVGHDQHPRAGNPRIERGFRIGAHQIQAQTKRTAPEQPAQHDDRGDKDDERDRNLECRAVADVRKLIDVLDRDRCAVAQHHGDAGKQQLRTQRTENWREPQFRDHDTVQQATEQSHGNGDCTEERRIGDGRGIAADELRQGQCGNHARQIGEADAREVDTAVAGDHREHDAECEQPEFGQLAAHRLQIVDTDKLPVRQRCRNQYHQHVDGEQEIQLPVGKQFSNSERGLHGEERLLQTA